MLKGCALSSGSSGNCFYIESYNARILIDAGISCRQVNERLERFARDIHDIDAIFISHEHWDHIRGLDVLCRGHRIPIFITKKTLECSGVPIDKSLINFIEPGKEMRIKDILVTPFSKSHDAFDPVSFLINYEDKNIGVFTDIGYCCNNIIEKVKKADLLFLESNHDIDMLKKGSYPAFLKKKILSKEGHLSNYDAAMLILEHAKKKLNHVVLSHLSINNNTEEKALKTFCGLVRHRKDLKKIDVSVSTRYKPTGMITI